MKDMPEHIIELDQALNESMSKAIPVIIKQIEKETHEILINKLKALHKQQQSEGYNRDKLDGIKLSIDTIRELY